MRRGVSYPTTGHLLLAILLHLLQVPAVYMCESPSAERRVFMWIWGNQTQVLTDATLAAAHNSSITDVPLGCGPKGGFPNEQAI